MLLIDDTFGILNFYAQVARLCRPRIERWSDWTTVHLVVIKEHRRVRDVLRGTNTSLSRELLKKWEGVAEMLDITSLLSLSSEERATKDLELSAWEVCHFGDCICHVVTPCHRIKVCKGCWRVKYCCEKCQRK